MAKSSSKCYEKNITKFFHPHTMEIEVKKKAVKWNAQADVVKSFYDLWGFIGGTAFGKYPEINEGIYPTNDTTYDQGMENVYEWYLANTLRKTKTERTYKILEIGFGYGSLADRFVKCGNVEWTGVNYSSIQCVHAAKRYGLNSGKHKIYNMSWYDFPFEEHKGEYDFVVARGCLEHYLPADQAALGNAHCKKIYADLFHKLHNCLNPKSIEDNAGKIIGGLIFMRNPWTDAQLKEIVQNSEVADYSDLYFVRKISRTWGGHYPCSNEEFFGYLEEHLKRDVLEDGTRDYYYTSLDWHNLVRKNLFKSLMKHPLHILGYFLRNKKHAFTSIKDIFFDGVWAWQFTPRLDFENFSDTPCKLQRFVYQLPANLLEAKK